MCRSQKVGCHLYDSCFLVIYIIGIAYGFRTEQRTAASKSFFFHMFTQSDYKADHEAEVYIS